jgi:hypothetical protein
MQKNDDFVFELTLYLRECASKDYSTLTQKSKDSAIAAYAKDIIKFFEKNK